LLLYIPIIIGLTYLTQYPSHKNPQVYTFLIPLPASNGDGLIKENKNRKKNCEDVFSEKNVLEKMEHLDLPHMDDQ
jgi:hypothetical protein